jgi:hypothetical protein
MPSVAVHANNSCLATYVEKRRNESNNVPVSMERSILPLLLDSLKANIINVKDSAITISLICILSRCSKQDYSRVPERLVQEEAKTKLSSLFITMRQVLKCRQSAKE